MGRDDCLTPKAIGKRIKAAGLQRLRWFCQMCEKQCRDENGYKCHINSEGHLRQMRLFSENAGGILTEYSTRFKQNFMQLLRTRYSTRRVLANAVYQEYITDRMHVHMNATCWRTLSAFCGHLASTGECIVESTDNGIYITYVDTSEAAALRARLDKHRDATRRDEEAEERQELDDQVARASALIETSAIVAAATAEISKATVADNKNNSALSLHMQQDSMLEGHDTKAEGIQPVISTTLGSITKINENSVRRPARKSFSKLISKLPAPKVAAPSRTSTTALDRLLDRDPANILQKNASTANAKKWDRTHTDT